MTQNALYVNGENTDLNSDKLRCANKIKLDAL